MAAKALETTERHLVGGRGGPNRPEAWENGCLSSRRVEKYTRNDKHAGRGIRSERVHGFECVVLRKKYLIEKSNLIEKWPCDKNSFYSTFSVARRHGPVRSTTRFLNAFGSGNRLYGSTSKPLHRNRRRQLVKSNCTYRIVFFNCHAYPPPPLSRTRRPPVEAVRCVLTRSRRSCCIYERVSRFLDYFTVFARSDVLYTGAYWPTGISGRTRCAPLGYLYWAPYINTT